MNKQEINDFLKYFDDKKERTIVIIDYGNVEKWKNSLKWKVDIKKLAQLVKNFSFGKEFLRRFYYGSDYGSIEKSKVLTKWSRSVLDRAKMNRFDLNTKRVKYIRDSKNKYGFEKKCDMDVEMIVDLIKERDNYDTIILFSGDGDLIYGIKYLKEKYNKICFVFSARGHIGKEIIDAKETKIINNLLYVNDFEYRLNNSQFRY